MRYFLVFLIAGINVGTCFAASCLPPNPKDEKNFRATWESASEIVHAKVKSLPEEGKAEINTLETFKSLANGENSTSLKQFGDGRYGFVRFVVGEEHIYFVSYGEVGACARLPVTPSLVEQLRKLRAETSKE